MMDSPINQDTPSNAQNLPDKKREMTLDVQHVVEAVSEWPLSELRSFRYAVGAMLHQDFLEMKREGLIEGIGISDGACPGMVGDVLASCDGSSKYLRFSLNLNSAEAQRAISQVGDFETEQFAETQLQYLKRFNDQHTLHTSQIFGVNGWISGERAGNFSITCGDAISELTVSNGSSVGSYLDRHRMQECAAIGCLLSMMNFAARAGMDGGCTATQSLIAGEPHEFSATSDPDGYGRLAKSLQLINEGHWAEIYDVLKRSGAPRIAAGESFTFGKVGRLLSSLPGSSEQVSYMFGWYHPDAKLVFGVDPEQVTEGKIAEPLTVIQGAHGLIERGFGDPGLSIATSGWANNTWLIDQQTGEMNDFFSVAAALNHRGSIRAKALRVSLPDTAASQPSLQRRSATRELGVTASLVALGEVLSVPDIRDGRALTANTSHLRSILEAHATVSEQ